MTTSDISHTILLVEDSHDDVFIFKRALKKAELENPLQLATDGQQAIEMLTASSDPAKRTETLVPFLVFLDLKLPYRNGFEVLEWVRTQPHLNNTVIIMLTGSEEPSDQQRARALGAHSYLVKPVTPADIVRLVDSLRPTWSTLGVDPVEFAGNSR
jgi:CheY-like chemotaxis protein